MQIQSTMPQRSFVRPQPPQQQESGDPKPPSDGFERSDLYAAGSGLAGGLALGAGGFYLGMHAGVEFGLRAANIGGGPVGNLLGVIVAIPLAAAFCTFGAIAGGAVGAASGMAVGVGLHHVLTKGD